MSFLLLAYKETKKRLLELYLFKSARVDNYESVSTALGVILLISIITSNSIIYGKISLFIVVFYAFAFYLILKTPKKRSKL